MTSRAAQAQLDPYAALTDRVRKLESDLRELRAARRLESASIDSGAVIVRDTGGGILAQLGDLGNGHRGAVLYDRSANFVVSDDEAAHRGLARPYIPLHAGALSVPDSTTTSATFADVVAGSAILQHAGLYAHLLVRASDGTTGGEVRLVVNGVQVGATLTVGLGAFAEATIGPAAVSSALGPTYSSILRIAVQARRTAGTGTVGVRLLSLLGLDSAWL
ncbi:hypothetical protein ABT369_38910 [Dactylosporangium sp. NPDC000244]|uniref:hypothetical protein n=1 Tax=Dactylosporangium sp. NPDC000244 TaxID=3154365 RepID=UPI003327A8C4